MGRQSKIRVTVRVADSCSSEVNCLRRIIAGREVNPKMTWAELFYEVSDIRFMPNSRFVISNVTKTRRYGLNQPISDLLKAYTYRKNIYAARLLEVDVAQRASQMDEEVEPETVEVNSRVQSGNSGSNHQINNGREGAPAHNFAVPGPSGSRTSEDHVFRVPMPPAATRRRPVPHHDNSLRRRIQSTSTSDSVKYFNAGKSTIMRLRKIRRETLQVQGHQGEWDTESSASDASTFSDVRHLINEKFKEKCMNRLSACSNSRFLAIREELRKVALAGKWVRTTSRIPSTANMLSDIFGTHLITDVTGVYPRT